jgi:ferredoxin-NAD(P)+ reductase (naphthalene dioxygenase ferredoxin-specific)
MAVTVAVEPLGRRINANIGETLLDVLKDAQIPISYSCMSGRCGTCRCRVIKGRVINTGGEIEHPKKGGGREVLACQASLVEDCTIEIPEVDEVVVHPARIIKGVISSIEEATHDIRLLKVKLAKPLDFTPGQYVTVQFTPEHIRPYSMAGLPTDPEMEFHIRKVPGGRVTEYIFNSIKEGDSVRISGPLGVAYLRRKHTGPMLCVGGGTGIAPVLSIVRGALEAGMTNPIHLYFGVRSWQDLYGADRLQKLAANYPQLTLHTVIATGPVDKGQRTGLVTDAIEKDIPSLVNWKAYLCGAPAMVESLNILVKRLGISPEHIHADAFYPSGV